jgi:excisionase family DNA binding protein
MDAVTEKPTKDDQKMAKRSLSLLDKVDRIFIRNHKSVEIDVRDGEVTHIKIPVAAFKFLKFILNNMAEGKAISLIPEETELSTQQAADMLNVSRPHLIKLLENGQIPFSKVGTHRRIKLDDLKEYDRRQKEKRKDALKKLAVDAQELDMGC